MIDENKKCTVRTEKKGKTEKNKFSVHYYGSTGKVVPDATMEDGWWGDLYKKSVDIFSSR